MRCSDGVKQRSSKRAPRFSGVTRTEIETEKVCVMSIRYLDRLAPAFLLFLGMIAAGATAGLGI